eukprot:COSAG03_NODE_26280_length_260_cov_0.639752_1_plen_60_part_01
MDDASSDDPLAGLQRVEFNSSGRAEADHDDPAGQDLDMDMLGNLEANLGNVSAEQWKQQL